MDELSRLMMRIDRLPVGAVELGLQEDLDHLQECREEGRTDRYVLAMVDSIVSELEAALLVLPYVEPSEGAGLDQGDSRVLNTFGGCDVCLSFDEGKPNPVTHLCVAGASGTGKSSLQAQVLIVEARKRPTLVLDTNRFYRKVRHMRDTHRFVRFNHLRINLYQGVRGVPPHVGDQVVTREICASYGLKFGEYEISEVVRELRKKGTPSLPSILTVLVAKRYQGFSRRSQYRDSAVLILSNLIEAAGEVFRCSQGMDVEALLKHNLVLEIDELLPIHQAFFARFLFEVLHLVALARQGES